MCDRTIKKIFIVMFITIFSFNIYAKENIIAYKVKYGDTLFGIAFDNNMNVADFLRINKIDDPGTYKLKYGSTLYVTKEKKVDKKESIELYEVKYGDTLSEIAERQNMSLDELYSLNDIDEKYTLKYDSKLKIYAITENKDVVKKETPNDKKSELYEVKQGDTLLGIAIKQNMKLSELLAMNNIDENYKLKYGSKLKVKSSSPSEKTDTVKKSEASEQTDGLYEVKQGDTLLGIAIKQNMKLSELLAMNNIDENYKLKYGSKLKVKNYFPSEKTNQNTEKKSAADKQTVTYIVKKNDSLLTIAKKYGMSYSEISELNNIKNPDNYILKVGEKLKVVMNVNEEKQTSIDYPKSNFSWPYKGNITEAYGRNNDFIGNRGINIAGNLGDKISASDDGVVEYVGKVRGFGTVVIISHDKEYNTIYAHLSESGVKENDKVKKGQTLGKIGNSGFIDKNELHFKICYQGKPLDPVKFLPKI